MNPRTRFLWLCMTPLVLGAAQVAEAHHSAASLFDMSKTITVQGVVSKFVLLNPHSYVYFNVKGANEIADQWRCELGARAALERLGWTSKMFTPGEKIIVKGAPAVREKNVCHVTSFIGPDGVEIHTRRMPTAAAVAGKSAARAEAARKPAGDDNRRPN